MIVVAGSASLAQGTSERAESLINEVVRLTRLEPGCLSYTFYYTAGDPQTIHVFEEWVSEEAINRHLQQEHTQRFLSAVGELLTGPPNIKKYEVTAVSDLF